MQFGRIDNNNFTMDVRYPLSPVQAFGIAMTSFHKKLACDWSLNNTSSLLSSKIFRSPQLQKILVSFLICDLKVSLVPCGKLEQNFRNPTLRHNSRPNTLVAVFLLIFFNI